jgi:hypothetical protein
VSKTETFETEIAVVVAQWDKAGRDLVPSFITNELVQSHKHGLARANEHTPFFEHYTYKGLRQHVGAFISKNYGDDDRDEKIDQQVLPGFDFVQRRYVITRGDEKVAVLVECMTDDELDAHVQFLRRRGQACMSHADELARFKHLRGASPLIAPNAA